METVVLEELNRRTVTKKTCREVDPVCLLLRSLRLQADWTHGWLKKATPVLICHLTLDSVQLMQILTRFGYSSPVERTRATQTRGMKILADEPLGNPSLSKTDQIS